MQVVPIKPVLVQSQVNETAPSSVQLPPLQGLGVQSSMSEKNYLICKTI